MKRYERISKEEIVDIFNRSANCMNCTLRDNENNRCNGAENLRCVEKIYKFLTADIETRPRFKTLDSCEDIVSLVDGVYTRFVEGIENDCGYKLAQNEVLSVVEYFKKMVIKELIEEVEVTE